MQASNTNHATKRAMKVWRQWNQTTRYYVAQVPGDGGRDWGYVTDASKAATLSHYWQRRFAADCRRVGAEARFMEGWTR